MAQQFEEWYRTMPIVTKSYSTICVLTTMRFPSLTQLHAPLRHYRVRAGKIELLDGVVREPPVDEVDLLGNVGGATPKLRSRMELERVSLELRFGDNS